MRVTIINSGLLDSSKNIVHFIVQDTSSNISF